MYKNSYNHVLVLSFLKRKISFFEKKKFLKFVRSQNKGKKNTCSCSYDAFFLQLLCTLLNQLSQVICMVNPVT